MFFEGREEDAKTRESHEGLKEFSGNDVAM